ncbi:MAG: T9SS type A sorting domain-containing protein [bacterium]|nr:T9SS type A sorting domain-containing protein [bacterium]
MMLFLREYRPHVHDRSFVEDLIEYHFDHGLLKAVLIIGDVEGSVPSYMINDPRVSNMYANDNYYVDFNDDFIADIPIGRIPSTNWNEFVWYVFKVLDYMDSLSQSKILPDRYNKHVSLGVINDTSCGEIFGQREQVLDLADNISQIMSSYTNSTVELHTTEDNDDWYPGCISSEYRISMRDSIGSQYNNDPYIFSIVSEHQSVQSLGGIVPGLSWWRMNTSEGDVRSIVVNTTCFGAASTSYIYTHDAWINTWASYEINKGGSIAVIGASTFMPYEVQNQMLPVLMDTLYSSLHKAPINRMSIGESLVYASEAMSEQSSLAKSYMFACEIVGDPMLKLYNVDNSVGVEEPATLINFVQYKGSTLVFGRQNVSEQSVVKCEIYDIRGRRVYSKKVNLSGSNGQFELWNSVDSDGGKPIGSGVYLYRVIANDETFTGKMTIVR